MDMAIEKAKHTGMGMVTMRNGRHLGMASYHAMRALDHNMIGICMTAVGPAVVPTFGKEPRLGTNPIAVAVPAANQHPFVLDFATSVVPVNKMRLAERIGSVIPGGWIADTAGVPIMQEGPAPEYAPGQLNLLPLGSNREGGSHKGYGLAGFVEILCGILSGGGFAGMGGQRGDSRHMVAAYSIDAFSPVDEFKAMMDEWMDYLKSTPPADGHERVLVPGQPEHEEETDRRSRGIPLHKEVIQWFRDISEELEVPYVL
jgi:LDH2 family malate/lactate/ureidoglycolate dehydrogenase